MYLPNKHNWVYSSLISLLTTIIVFVIVGIITISKTLTVWTDATTLYVNKNNPKIKIVTRYINKGAYGGGTEKGDYEVVVMRPITPLFKMETEIDTNKINKSDWIRTK